MNVPPANKDAVEWWNRRAAPQWSQEPPTETGDYWLAWRSSLQVPWRCEPIKISDFKDGEGLRIFVVGFDGELLQTKLNRDQTINDVVCFEKEENT
jgi:hypothetical protein